MKLLTASLATIALCTLALASAAHAEFGIEPGSFFAKTHPSVPLLSVELPGAGTWRMREVDTAAIRAASPVTQAGAHPDASSGFIFNQVAQNPEDNVKDVVVDLPPGLLGDPEAVAPCSRIAFAETLVEGPEACPPASQVGVVTVHIHGNEPYVTAAVYRLTTTFGRPASFGFAVLGHSIVLQPQLRSDGDYGLSVVSPNVSDFFPLREATLTFWGVPADPIHDPERLNPRASSGGAEWGVASEATPRPFLSNPTWCDSGPLDTAIRVRSWQEPNTWLPADSADPGYHSASPAPTECDRLRFGGPGAEASLTFQPDVHAVGAPSGYEVKLRLPYNEDPEGLANPTLRDTRVTLPEGVVVNPSAANGLGACTTQQIGYMGNDFPLPNPIHFDEAVPGCPNSSKIGTVEVHTPLLEKPLRGAVYLAAQDENPFGSLLAIYLAIDDEETGIVVKLAGHVEADPVTGRLTATFEDNPELPFTELDLSFFGGQDASLETPSTCGTATTSSELTPWSAPESGPPVVSTDSFQITEGCAAHGFAPSFTAGTTNNQAGAYSPFSVAFSRTDQDQNLGGVTVQTPPGLLGMISQVPLCGEAQANAGTCPAASEIGHVVVGAGVGSDPVYLPAAGQPENPVYLTTGYKGAPFGLSVVVPAIAGPFNLGTVVVRASVSVDPHTAQVTITSDPLPTILKGIPLQVRSVNVVVDRPGFMFNPTNCAPLAVGGAITSTQGAVANASSRFQAANCASLPFKPSFSASTQAKTSKADGASLVVKVTQKPGEAGIHKVDLQLPLALPARLIPTLQNACTEAQFNANPAGCPVDSFVGTATAVTPVLSAPLSGPAILVSHGGAAFPDLEFLLQGEGVEIILDGGTDIKKGITYSRFETVPDAPISSFQTTLPEGPHSILASNLPAKAKYSLCGRKLVIPTTITGQNGAVVTQQTNIAVTGCGVTKPKPKKLTRAQKLAKALAACKKKPKRQRASCEKKARKRYGPVAKKKKAKKH